LGKIELVIPREKTMPKICYEPKNFHDKTLAVIEDANEIIKQYRAMNYDLTLRQLYYQMVARDLIPNTDRDYKRLGRIISDARMAGLVDWRAITDRTRGLRALSHWRTPQSIAQAVLSQYRVDKWTNQPYRIEVWVEKDALRDVVARACNELDIPYFSCRGYSSASEMWIAAQRLDRWQVMRGQAPIVLHLADHDPSGIDMTRDIRDRLHILSNGGIPRANVRRIALTMEQIEEYSPPPNPAKVSDSRSDGYIEHYGTESWELDALDPPTMRQLIIDEVLEYRDEDKWAKALKVEEVHRGILKGAIQEMPDVEPFG
jgi:hypothetical protein